MIQPDENAGIVYIDISGDSFKLGGSSFAQSLNTLGNETPAVKDPRYFVNAFQAIQHLVNENIFLPDMMYPQEDWR